VQTARIERIAHPLDQGGIVVDDGDFIALGRKPLGNAVPDLPGPADDDAHLEPQRLDLAV
jgi:hypothetical protein